MKHKIFVDGQVGTTGLQIKERLAQRADLDVLEIDLDKRKDIDTRRKHLNDADIVFLCLPDQAAKESVTLITNNKTRVIDASTAHRTNPDWVYGLPELSKGHRKKIENARLVANPGCHATGFVLPLYPLIQKGIVPQDYPITSHSITGYSGGGRQLIEKYENGNSAVSLNAPSHYALGLKHKHVPEMQQKTGLKYQPHFTPVLGNYYQGMAVAIPLYSRLMERKYSAKDIQEVLATYYADEYFVHVMPFEAENLLEEGRFNPMACNHSNKAEIFVFGHDEQTLLVTRLDNLGKGASGAAVQNMNIMLGIDERTGLE